MSLWIKQNKYDICISTFLACSCPFLHFSFSCFHIFSPFGKLFLFYVRIYVSLLCCVSMPHFMSMLPSFSDLSLCNWLEFSIIFPFANFHERHHECLFSWYLSIQLVQLFKRSVEVFVYKYWLSACLCALVGEKKCPDGFL